MEKNQIIFGAMILLGVAVVACLWIENIRQLGTAIMPAMITSTPASGTMPPKVIAPARIIPADVNQSMQAALAARQQKLAQLARGK